MSPPDCPHGTKVRDGDSWLCPSGVCDPEPIKPSFPHPRAEPVCPHGKPFDRDGWPDCDRCLEADVEPQPVEVEVVEQDRPEPVPAVVPVVADLPVYKWQEAFRDAPCDKTLTLRVKGVGFILATYADTDTGRSIYPKQQNVAKAAGICRQQVNKPIATLVRLGWLTEERRRAGGIRQYRLTLPAPAERVSG